MNDMSTLEISIVVYETILKDTVARYRKAGMSPTMATLRAEELMAGAFVSEDDDVLQDELQRDHDEKRHSRLMTAIHRRPRPRKLCRAIRTRTDSYSGDIRHWLLDLHKLEETRMVARCFTDDPALASDAVALRALAEAIETTRFGLIQQEKK